MRVLVTGGAGYIGSITARTLLAAGHECVILDTLERGWRESIDPRCSLVVGSVGDPDAVEEAIGGCDGVVHMAGYIEVSESQSDPEKYFRNNSLAPRHASRSDDGARGAGPCVLVDRGGVWRA